MHNPKVNVRFYSERGLVAKGQLEYEKGLYSFGPRDIKFEGDGVLLMLEGTKLLIESGMQYDVKRVRPVFDVRGAHWALDLENGATFV